MTTDSNLDYHFRELEIAKNPASNRFSMPVFKTTDQVILDIGCGIGQTLVASPEIHEKQLIGLDIDLKCLTFGRRRFEYISYVNGNGGCLPFHSGSFDLVISRVTLPYVDIQQALFEAIRVLKNNGRVWFTFHPWSMTIKHLINSFLKFKVKDVIFRSYVIVNGLFFHFFGRQFQFFINKRFESFQTVSSIHRAMSRAGFKDISVSRRGGIIICTARTRDSNGI